MKLKKKLLKDILLRKAFNKYESKMLSLKILIRLDYLNYLEILNNMSKIKTTSFLTRSRNRCFITSRRGSIYKKLSLSRIKVRELTNNGLIPGMKKHSW